MPQPSNVSRIEVVRAKQLAARRKMQSLSGRSPRPELSNANWHEQHLKRVVK
ncbi:MAG: hypothetical protein ACXWAT_11050 [Methylobacter sp.]